MGSPIGAVARKLLFYLFPFISAVVMLSWFVVLRSTSRPSFLDRAFLPAVTTLSVVKSEIIPQSRARTILVDREIGANFAKEGRIENVVNNVPNCRSSGGRKQLKVFMYDMLPEFHFELLEWKAERGAIWPDIRKHIPSYPGGLNLQHSIEYWLTLDLLASEFPTQIPRASSAILSQEDVVIVGAGIAGLATSLALHRLGIRTLVLESSSSLRITGFSLGVWTNAWKALDALGIGDSLRQQHQLLDGFSSKVVSMEESGCLKLLHLVDGTVIKTKVLIGCDGVNSMVAKWIGMNELVVSERLAVRGSAIFPQGHGFASKLFMFAGKGFRAGCIPCNDKIMYWFFAWTPSIQERDLQDNPSKMKEFLLSKLQSAADMKKVVDNTELDGIMMAPLRYRHPLEFLSKNLTKDNVCVAGDALHPMTPDLGQGGCAALEDGVTLGRCLVEALNSVRKKDDTACLVGIMQSSDGKITTFLRDHILANFLAGLALKIAGFDCGKLTCGY
ncbi:Monooxygenase 2 [Linum perenne]